MDYQRVVNSYPLIWFSFPVDATSRVTRTPAAPALLSILGLSQKASAVCTDTAL